MKGQVRATSPFLPFLLLCLTAGCTSVPTDSGKLASQRERPLRVIVTVKGRGSDWQNRVNRWCAKVLDGFGRCHHLPVTDLEECLKGVIALAERLDTQEGVRSQPMNISLWTHGTAGGLSFGQEALTLETLKTVPHLAGQWDKAQLRWRAVYVGEKEARAKRDKLLNLSPKLREHGFQLSRINLEACSVGLGWRGRSFALNLADALGAEVFCISGEHLGIRRFGKWYVLRPGQKDLPLDQSLVVKRNLGSAEDPRGYFSSASLALRCHILDHELRPDQQRAGVVLRVGRWSRGEKLKGFYGTDYLVDDNQDKGKKEVHYLPIIPAPGRYEVQIWHPASEDLAANVPVTIKHAGGESEAKLDQTCEGGRWKSLGTFFFKAGKWDSAAVILRTSGTTRPVVADAVRFVSPAEEAEVYLANQDVIEDLVREADLATDAERSSLREKLIGSISARDPGHEDYGKLQKWRVREHRGCAASKAWRSGDLQRFSKDQRRERREKK